jgi:uncharacterized protein (DUF58 family)
MPGKHPAFSARSLAMAETSISEIQKKVRRIEIVSARLVTEQMAGEYHSVFKGQGMEFEEVRPYIAGDEIRSIDWNVTARAGEPHVKRYREEREMTVFVVVDVSASCRFGTRGEFKSELMAELSAVFAFASVANNDRVGLLLCSDRIELLIPPRKGKRHVLRLVRDVLGFQPQAPGTKLALALDHLRHVLHRRSVVFVISDFFDLEIESSLAGVARHHDVIAIAVDDPFEGDLPNVGMIEVIDAESGEMRAIDTSDLSLRRAYRAYYKQRRQERRQMMNRNEVGLVELATGKPYAADLVRFFRWRARRRR